MPSDGGQSQGRLPILDGPGAANGPERPVRVLLLHARPSAGNVTVPYACLAVAAPLVARGHEVVILDESATPDFSVRVAEEARKAEVVGVSCFTGRQIDASVAAADVVRRAAPAVPIVWGGYHPSLYPELTVQSSRADFVVTGQGEWTLLDLVERLARGEAPEHTPGLWRTVDGEVIQNPGAPSFVPLDRFPRYPFELIEPERFLIDNLTERSISYHSSIGCPFRCNFCTVTQIYDKRWSGLPPARVVEDVRYLVDRTGATSVEFYDNNFFVNDARTEGVAAGLLDAGLERPWSAEARPDKIASYGGDMMRLLTRSGLSWVFIGAESGHDRVLEMMERDTTVADILAAAEQLARHRVDVTFSFNLGYPGEPDDNFHRTERLCRELLRINPRTELMIYITTAYESTPAFHKATEVGEAMTTASLEDWSHLDQRSGAKKRWLAGSYADKLWNFQMGTFYATSFHHRKLLAQRPNNLILRSLRRLAKVHLRSGYYDSIVELRALSSLFHRSTRLHPRAAIDMWTGRS